MIWINFLHIYQPPTLEKKLLIQITKDSYLNIISILKKNPNHKITLNISGCLTEYLHQTGFAKLINEIKKLVKNEQIELVGTAAFHPVLPLIPIKEVTRQIKVNNDINKRHFGSAYNPKGFYLPEMAYSNDVAIAIKKEGFEWIILDEIALVDNDVDYNKLYTIKKIGLKVVFRNRNASKTFVPSEVSNILQKKIKPKILITATDGELYGHNYIDKEKTFTKILKNKELKTETITKYLNTLKDTKKIKIRKCSWESTKNELQKNIPYNLWNNPKNKIHKNLWLLASYALELNYKYLKDKNHFASRLHLEKGLASCTFWWASDKDFHLFSEPAWNPEEIEKGALELLKSVRALSNIQAKTKIKAEKIFLEIHKLIWIKHWKKINIIKSVAQ